MTTVVALLLLAFLLLFLEIFLPGGLLAILAGGLIMAASAVAYQNHGIQAAIFVFVGGGLLACVLFFIELQFLTRSAVARRLTSQSQIAGGSVEAPVVEHLLGTLATSVTPLNPTGRIRVEGGALMVARLDSGWVPAGTRVEITGVDLNHVRVRQTPRTESFS